MGLQSDCAYYSVICVSLVVLNLDGREIERISRTQKPKTNKQSLEYRI